MCGRFTLLAPIETICDEFEVANSYPLLQRFNIAPTQQVVAVRLASGTESRELVHLRWGLIPSWSQDPAIGNRLINARAETVAEKPSFRSAIKSRRCLIVADGFYEWEKKPAGKKQPILFRLKHQGLFAFAGLWERWSLDPENPVESCTIITTEANSLLQSIHDRMPVIIPRERIPEWLGANVLSRDRLDSLLVPYPADDMSATPVSTHVNSPRNDDPACIEAAP